MRSVIVPVNLVISDKDIRNASSLAADIKVARMICRRTSPPRGWPWAQVTHLSGEIYAVIAAFESTVLLGLARFSAAAMIVRALESECRYGVVLTVTLRWGHLSMCETGRCSDNVRTR